MEGIMEALNFNAWTFLFQAANLFLVALLLYWILYKPITDLVRAREERIEGSLNNAAQAKEEATKLLSQYQEQMERARTEAQEIVARAAKTGEEIKASLIGEARAEAEKTFARAKAEIENEKQQALVAIRDEAATLAVLAAEKLLTRTLTPADHERLAAEFIQGVRELH